MMGSGTRCVTPSSRRESPADKLRALLTQYQTSATAHVTKSGSQRYTQAGGLRAVQPHLGYHPPDQVLRIDSGRGIRRLTVRDPPGAPRPGAQLTLLTAPMSERREVGSRIEVRTSRAQRSWRTDLVSSCTTGAHPK